MGEGSAIPTDPHHTPTFIQPSPQPQKTQKLRRPKKKDTQVPQSSVPSDNVVDEAVYKELDDSLATPSEAGSQRTTSGGGPRRQETMGDTIAQTRFENVSKLYNDPLLARGNTLRSGEDSLKLNEMMELCTNLQQRVLDLEKTKTTQAEEIVSLKRRVKKLEQKKRDEEDLGEDASKQGRRIHDIDVDEDITTVNDDNEIFDMDALAVSAAIITDVEITLAQALAELKSAKPKADKVMIQEPDQGTTTTTFTTTTAPTTITAASTRPKDKGIVIHK
ncbi:hypothetical protein Tco_1048871 [Tanacetum coccineum]